MESEINQNETLQQPSFEVAGDTMRELFESFKGSCERLTNAMLRDHENNIDLVWPRKYSPVLIVLRSQEKFFRAIGLGNAVDDVRKQTFQKLPIDKVRYAFGGYLSEGYLLEKKEDESK